MARARTAAAQVGLRVRIEAETLDVREGEQPPPLAAYAFEPGGKLVARQELKPGSATTIALREGKEPHEIRLLIGPQRLQGEQDFELLAELTRLGAEEFAVRPDFDRDVLRVRSTGRSGGAGSRASASSAGSC
jgi:hypothetical protein